MPAWRYCPHESQKVSESGFNLFSVPTSYLHLLTISESSRAPTFLIASDISFWFILLLILILILLVSSTITGSIQFLVILPVVVFCFGIKLIWYVMMNKYDREGAKSLSRYSNQIYSVLHTQHTYLAYREYHITIHFLFKFVVKRYNTTNWWKKRARFYNIWFFANKLWRHLWVTYWVNDCNLQLITDVHTYRTY